MNTIESYCWSLACDVNALVYIHNATLLPSWLISNTTASSCLVCLLWISSSHLLVNKCTHFFGHKPWKEFMFSRYWQRVFQGSCTNLLFHSDIFVGLQYYFTLLSFYFGVDMFICHLNIFFFHFYSSFFPFFY